MAKVKVLGWIAEKVGFREKEIPLSKPIRITDFLPILTEIREDHVIILVNNKPASKDTIIRNSDNVVIMPVVSGG